jgi:hypothetical protein
LAAFPPLHAGRILAGMKGKFPNGLKAAMKVAHLGPTALGELAGTSKQNVQRWADGERELTAPWAERLAPYVGATPEGLLFPNRRFSTTEVPLLTWAAVARLALSTPVIPVQSKQSVTVADLPHGSWIAMQVDVPVMNLVAPVGSIIVADRTDTRLEHGGDYVFRLANGVGKFRRYMTNPERFQPQSTDPNAETIYPTPDLHVIARVGYVFQFLK